MDEFLKGIGAAVAVVASLGAVALVVDQFTLRARLRRTEAWAVAMLAEDLSAERARILRSIRLDATSRIVAGILMPVRFFLEGVVWTIACAMIVVGVLRAESFWTSAGLASVLFAFCDAEPLYPSNCAGLPRALPDRVGVPARPSGEGSAPRNS